MNEFEKYKLIANDIFAAFERHQKGECTYDRALEDAGLIFKEHAEKLPIVGYVNTGALKKTLYNIYDKKKVDDDKFYIYHVEVHQNDIDLIKRVLES